VARKDRARRPARNLKQEKRFLIVVEGDVTEREYLGAIKRSRQMKSVEVRIEHRYTDPVGIVNEAKRLGGAARKAEPFDEIWCVFDVEAKLTQQTRFGLRDGLDTALRAGLKCAVSNPCFEIWLLWHKANWSAWIASDAVQRRCEELGITHGKDGKHIRDVGSLLRDCYLDARNRANNSGQLRILRGDANADNQALEGNETETPEDTNPSSGVHRLVDAICAAFPVRE
jgi:hypothetical protein